MIPTSDIEDAEFEVIGFGTRGINTATYSSDTSGREADVQRVHTGAGGTASKVYFKITGHSPPYNNFRPRLCYIHTEETTYIADILAFSESEEGMSFCIKPRV